MSIPQITNTIAIFNFNFSYLLNFQAWKPTGTSIALMMSMANLVKLGRKVEEWHAVKSLELLKVSLALGVSQMMM